MTKKEIQDRYDFIMRDYVPVYKVPEEPVKHVRMFTTPDTDPDTLRWLNLQYDGDDA